jgi:hypothetical protein
MTVLPPTLSENTPPSVDGGQCAVIFDKGFGGVKVRRILSFSFASADLRIFVLIPLHKR